MNKINIDLKSNTYPVFVDHKNINDLVNIVDLKDYDKIFLLVDMIILKLYSKEKIFNLGFNLISIDSQEKNKNLSSFESIINDLIEKECSRNSLIIVLGGGVVLDMGGFVASVYKRGLHHILIPTTLLGMVDAAIGGKTGINNNEGKNFIGTFKQPKAIIVDIDFLNTLSNRHMLNGFAEIIKYSLICDRKLFDCIIDNFDSLIGLSDLSLIENIIVKCIEHKKRFVVEDEFDRGNRMLLNFGHTFGHALESVFEYKNILHGEAIYYGMLAASYLSFTLGHIKKNELDKISSFLFSINKLNINDIDVDKVMEIMKNDKKNYGNSKRFIVLKNIGDAGIVENIPEKYIRESLMYAIKKK